MARGLGGHVPLVDDAPAWTNAEQMTRLARNGSGIKEVSTGV